METEKERSLNHQDSHYVYTELTAERHINPLMTTTEQTVQKKNKKQKTTGNDEVLMETSGRFLRACVLEMCLVKQTKTFFFCVSVCAFLIKPLKSLSLNLQGRRIRQAAAFVSCRITILSDRHTCSPIPVSYHAPHFHFVHTFSSQKINEYFEGRSRLEYQAGCLKRHEIWFGI
jgi:hypothetical protein